MSEVAITHRRAGRARLRVPGPVRWVGQVLTWAVILACSAALAVGVLVPRLAGATPYTILTGSMSPRMPPGTLVVDRSIAAADIGVGTVVTYQLHSGQPEVVTHRVVAVRDDLHGHQTYVTQGDANPVPDQAPVRYEQIRGSRWYDVPYLGYLGHAIDGRQRQLLTYLLAGGLGAYALGMFAGASRDRRRQRRGSAADRVLESV